MSDGLIDRIDLITKNVSEDDAYRKYFQGMLKKRGIKSPSELSDEEKKKFFDSVKSGWKK